MSDLIGLTARLKRAGYKLTDPRLAIIDVLEREDKHLSPDEVLALGQHSYPKLSRATVYRTLELLVELGLIRPIYLGDTCQRYVTAQGGHHHLVCIGCGAAFEFEHCPADELAARLSQQFHFEIPATCWNFTVCVEPANRAIEPLHL